MNLLKTLATRAAAAAGAGAGSYYALQDLPEPWKTRAVIAITIVASLIDFGKGHLPQAIATAEKVRAWVKAHPNAWPWLTRFVARFDPVEQS